MKRCKNITGWTDYPIEELGDVLYHLAPIRRVKVLTYDYDKYVVVEVEGIITSSKSGYLYRKPGRFSHERRKMISVRKLERGIYPFTYWQWIDLEAE